MSDDEKNRILARRAAWVAAATGVVGVGGFLAFRALGSSVEAATCLSVMTMGSAGGGGGKDESDAKPLYEVFSAVVFVYGDDKLPVDGAQILHYGLLLGTTGSSGRASIELRGMRQEVAELEVRCPEGYESPVKLSIAMLPGLLDVTATCRVRRDAR
jgi:hypothetical protein